MPKIDFERERIALDREITFFHFGRAQRKVRKCIRLAQKNQDFFFLNYFLAQDEILGENYLEAVTYLKKALILRKSDGCTYNDMALCFAELGQTSKALDLFNLGLAKDPDCASLYHNKGWLLNELELHREAILCFRKALELAPRRPESYYSLADSYLASGDPKQARTYFSKALSEVVQKCSYISRDIKMRLKSL